MPGISSAQETEAKRIVGLKSAGTRPNCTEVLSERQTGERGRRNRAVEGRRGQGGDEGKGREGRGEEAGGEGRANK